MREISQRHSIDETFIKKWRKLWHESRTAHIFNTPEWFIASCEVYDIKHFTIVTIIENDELLLVLPLVRKKIFGISVLASSGG